MSFGFDAKARRRKGEAADAAHGDRRIPFAVLAPLRLCVLLAVSACAQKQTPRARLNDTDPAVRRQAVLELAQAEDVDGLLLGLQHEDDETRLRCALALLASGRRTADKLVYFDPWFAGTLKPFATKCLADENPPWRAIAKRALERLD